MEPIGLKILVVDDETAARRGLVSLLSGWGYAVEEAADGQEALEKAVAVLPSVVLTDLVMPRLDGHALLKALRDFKSNTRPGYDASMAEVVQPISDAELADLAYLMARAR